MSEPILKVVNLKKHYPIRKGMFNKQVATRYVVDGVDIEIMPGETVALVGESGCGKSVLLRVLLGIEDATEGEIYYYGKNTKEMSKQESRRIRKKVQMIFQDAASALHPRFTVMESLSEPLLLGGMKNKREIEKRVCETLEKVGMDASYRFRSPGSLSGGQRQRVLIARSLVERPELILADEPISALDVSLQAQVLNLLMDLQ
ncbi:MAG: ABC transporter ATP-binding protein, partial [Clostridiales bacterium]|nr:ABC transporter ATP-binding protein [Clostridiales bacterium]